MPDHLRRLAATRRRAPVGPSCGASGSRAAQPPPSFDAESRAAVDCERAGSPYPRAATCSDHGRASRASHSARYWRSSHCGRHERLACPVDHGAAAVRDSVAAVRRCATIRSMSAVLRGRQRPVAAAPPSTRPSSSRRRRSKRDDRSACRVDGRQRARPIDLARFVGPRQLPRGRGTSVIACVRRCTSTGTIVDLVRRPQPRSPSKPCWAAAVGPTRTCRHRGSSDESSRSAIAAGLPRAVAQ